MRGVIAGTGKRLTEVVHRMATLLTSGSHKRSLMITALRYYDTFVKQDGAWQFAERLLYVDWIEERILS